MVLTNIFDNRSEHLVNIKESLTETNKEFQALMKSRKTYHYTWNSFKGKYSEIIKIIESIKELKKVLKK